MNSITAHKDTMKHRTGTAPRRIKRPTLIDIFKAFNPVDAMLARLADGWIHEENGVAVFYDDEHSDWFEICPALRGWIALWARLDAHYHLGINLEPMRILVAQLADGSDVFPELVSECQAVVDRCRRAYRGMDMHVVGSMVKTQQIANYAARGVMSGAQA